ncbi:uncharacterized protein LOC135074677 [Ostrinia nubilalis]|uniref:uncharacterized protein LOC135074677 n=1 Tax=Ostrinia nubilalis TaxID=29057 RepID=UPI0030823D40
MDKSKLLSGEEIVDKGAIKIDVTLPEVGLKDVKPDGSWLEGKQIQSALEARKHLVEAERIEKSGILSHAEWQDELKLAEVTKQSGSHWQFFGHHRDKKLYLRPEEALFLIEVNCLVLKYNGVTVSLQQAYSLLLSDDITIVQYKVYASLSRLGYKVFKHVPKVEPPDNKPKNDNLKSEDVTKTNVTETVTTSDEKTTDNKSENNDTNEKMVENLNIVSDEPKNASELNTIGTKDSVMEVETPIMTHTDDNKPIESAEEEKTNDETLEKEESNVNNTIETKDSLMEVETPIVIKTEENKPKENAEGNKTRDTLEEESNGNNTIENNDTVMEVETPIVTETDENKPKENAQEEKTGDNNLEVESNVETKDSEMEIETPIVTETDENKPKENADKVIINDKEMEEECVIISEEKVSDNTCEVKTNDNTNEETNKDLSMDVDKTSDSDANSDRSLQNQIREATMNNIDVSDACSTNGSENIDPLKRYCQWKLHKLMNRQDKTSKTSIHQKFENCPDLLENQVATMKVPNDDYIPHNIYLNKLYYVINVENIRKKNNNTVSEATYSLSDEVNGAHIKRVTSSGLTATSNPRPMQTFFQKFGPTGPYRHYAYYRPSTHYYQFNLFYQRPYMPFNPRSQFFPRMQNMPTFPGYSNNPPRNTQKNQRKRRKASPKSLHFEAIKNLAAKLKHLCDNGNVKPENIQALQKIITTYNDRYLTKLRLSAEYEVVNDENIVEVIDLDDDEASTAKKPKKGEKCDLFHENLNKIRQMANALRSLEVQNKTSGRHRRALSGLIKTFNKSFKAEIYMNENFQVIDKRFINLDSDSDSDSVVEVKPKNTGKKLRNPFNILRRLARNTRGDSLAQTGSSNQVSLEKAFKKTWVPNDDDFGRPEVTQRDTMIARIIQTKNDEFITEFYKNQSFDNWVDLKIAFLQNIEDTNALLDTREMMNNNNIDLKALVKLDDCTDMLAVLKKLSIIKNNSDIDKNNDLSIDFDVYNRDVKNFRKASRPKPHFRIVCIEETAACPLGVDIASLHAKYEDDVTILFAVVGIGSISYLQMNPSDLPVYVSCNELR